MKYKKTKNESPERQAMREMIGSYMKEHLIKDGADINEMMREMMSIVLEEALDGEFEPQIIQKHQNTLTQEMENKILSMYAKGITQADIRAHFEELYGISLSESTISRIRIRFFPQ